MEPPHTEPIFDTLNILNFNKLVVHKIGLMMFKYSKDLVPLPIVEFLFLIMSFTITIPDKANRFILQLSETKRSTKHLHFMALEFGILYLRKS